ncbi:MAG TPA: acyltransferase family protein, partial [Longimicrobiales bacterium]|nr:acyltransferase family protein [Longimicrobiales bacterium]
MSSTFRYLANPRSPRQLHALDGLRALAILLVLFRHGFKVVDFAAVQQTSSSPLMSAYAVLARSGWMGVDLFFVLSGFLIGGQLLKFYESARPLGILRRFYVNRFFRIIPAYFG